MDRTASIRMENDLVLVAIFFADLVVVVVLVIAVLGVVGLDVVVGGDDAGRLFHVVVVAVAAVCLLAGGLAGLLISLQSADLCSGTLLRRLPSGAHFPELSLAQEHATRVIKF